MSEALGKKLVYLRNSCGKTQQEVATLAGVNIRTVQRAESGNTIDLPTLSALARALGVSIQELAEPNNTPTDVQALLAFLAQQSNGQEKWFRGEDLRSGLGWGITRINDAVALTDQMGFLFMSNTRSNTAFNFDSFKVSAAGRIYSDPTRRLDRQELIRFLASQGEGNMRFSVPELEKHLRWERLRVQDTIHVLAEEGLVRAGECSGPLKYVYAQLTPEGRLEATHPQ